MLIIANDDTKMPVTIMFIICKKLIYYIIKNGGGQTFRYCYCLYANKLWGNCAFVLK